MFRWKIPDRSRWWLRAAAVTVAAVALGAAAGSPAYAHTVLVSSAPQEGEEVGETPDSVVLTFSGPVSATDSMVEVIGPDGSSAAADEPVIEGSTVTVPLHITVAGNYTVTYEVLAQDGHVTSGELAFTVTPEAVPAAAPTTPPAPTDPPQEPPAAPPTTAPPADAASAAGDRGDGSSGWWWWLVAGAAVLLLGGGLVLWRRSDRTAGSGTAA